MKVYLDVDGVLLGHRPGGGPDVILADGAADLLRWALAHHDVHWLTTHCRDGNGDGVLRYLSEYADDEFLGLAARVKPSTWRTLKTEPFAEHDGAFVWLDDAPLFSEQKWLADRDWLDRWLHVDTRRRPGDLRRALGQLQARI